MAEVKYAHRLPPCPDYDIAGVESWLEDLARDGLLLDRDTPFFGFYAFIRTAPQTVRYRLEPAVKAQSFWDGDPGMPKEEAVALYADLGWEYITRYGDFYIYRSSDPSARELHTDPDIQAAVLNTIGKTQRNDLFVCIIAVALYAVFGVLRYPAGLMIALGMPAMVIFYSFFLISLIRPAVSVWKLQALRKRILNGESIHQKTDWRASALRHRLLKHIPDMLFFFVLISAFISNLMEDAAEIPLTNFTGDPPFVTIADLNPGGEYEMQGLDYANRTRRWESWPFVDNWEWFEFASIRLEDGKVLSGPLDVTYHEALSPALADQLANELIAYADSGKYFTEATPMDTGFQNIRGYRYLGKYGLDTVLLICDNIVIEAQVLLDNTDTTIAKDLWIKLMAERLVSE